MPVYLSLVPIIGGCGLAALTELNFNMTGLMGAMISNLAFVFRNVFSKKGMKGKSVSGMNYYACLSLLSLLMLTPYGNITIAYFIYFEIFLGIFVILRVYMF